MNHDVLIMGAGAAGTTAAILLHRRGVNPILVESASKPTRKAHAADWLCGAGFELMSELGIDCEPRLGEPFKGITFHSADLKKTAESAADRPQAFRVDYPQLVAHLHQLARQAGIRIVYGAQVARMNLGETRVSVQLENGNPIEAAFLLLADGAGRTLAGGLGSTPAVLASVPARTDCRWVATLACALSRDAQSGDANMHWLLGPDRHQGCLLWWREGASMILSLLASGTGPSIVDLLSVTAGKLAGAGLIAARDPVDPSAVVLRPAPARSALEIESHVDKRCLLIGDAGGFISETSGEGIYPAVWSARLAVDSIVAARDSRHPQDQLRQYSTSWRSTMAEYLRPPNTDMHFLLPLIFSNRQMADRMAAAFWKGQNI